MEIAKETRVAIENARYQLDKVYTEPFMVLDCETNGTSDCDVMSVSAIICQYTEGCIKILDKYDRFYYPRTDYNPYALRVHGLNEATLDKKREGTTYPRHFCHDLADFNAFCRNVKNVVGFNVGFDIGFVERALPSDYEVFDLYLINKNIIIENNKLTKVYCRYNLEGTALFYGIDASVGPLHSSLWDVIITIKILQEMMRV